MHKVNTGRAQTCLVRPPQVRPIKDGKCGNSGPELPQEGKGCGT